MDWAPPALTSRRIDRLPRLTKVGPNPRLSTPILPANARANQLELRSNLEMAATSLRATVALVTLAAVSACEVCHLHYFHKVRETLCGI